MFTLKFTNGTLALMRSGEPFKYTSRELARMGKRYLEARYKTVLTLTPAG